MTSPRVTVLMPVLDATPYLPDAIASMQAQTYSHFVLLIVDDGSTDGSVDYLRSLGDSRIQVLADGQHRGLGGALNHALAHVTTEYIARMDGDDLCHPARFEQQVALLDASPGIGVVGTQFTHMGNGGRTGFGRRLPLTHEKIIHDLNRGVLAVIHASLMIRTKEFRQIGGYRFSGIGEDWDMLLRLAEVTRFANLPLLGYFYRLHARNATALHQRLTQERIGYACRCAQTRRQSKPEPTEAAFRAELMCRPLPARLESSLDAYSVARYYTARNYILNSRPIVGYCHLLVGAVASPRRVLGRLRTLLRPRHAVGGAAPQEGGSPSARQRASAELVG